MSLDVETKEIVRRTEQLRMAIALRSPGEGNQLIDQMDFAVDMAEMQIAGETNLAVAGFIWQ